MKYCQLLLLNFFIAQQFYGLCEFASNWICKLWILAGSKSAVNWNLHVLDFDGKVVLLAEVGICKQWNLAVKVAQVEFAGKRERYGTCK